MVVPSLRKKIGGSDGDEEKCEGPMRDQAVSLESLITFL